MKKTNYLTDEELKILLKSYYEDEIKLMTKMFKPIDIEIYIKKVYEKAENMPIIEPINTTLKLTNRKETVHLNRFFIFGLLFFLLIVLFFIIYLIEHNAFIRLLQ